MGRFSGYLVGMFLLVLLSTSTAIADSFFIYAEFGGTWHDANKTTANTEDDLICWAATASNILAWGEWGTPEYDTEEQIFQHYQDHWTDNTGYMSWAWKWWFDGSPPKYTFASYPDVSGGGNFYPALDFTDYYEYSSGGDTMSAIDSLLREGKGVGLVISKTGASYSHAVTVWGYEYSEPGVYTSIYLTDSDDGVLGLREYPLIWQDNAWYLGGGYSGWKLGLIQVLGYHHPPMHPTPIAPSWMLLGTGVVALFLRRPRRRPEKQNAPSLQKA